MHRRLPLLRQAATFGKGTLYRAVVGKTRHEIRTISHIWRFYKVRTS